MKYRILFFIIFINLSSFYILGQSVVTTKQSQRIKGENAVGYATTLEAPQQEVNTSLQRYLKTFGKPKQQGETWVVPEASINGKVYPHPLYAVVKTSGIKTMAWMGILENADSTNITSQLEALVKTFGVNFYRDKIQAQIDEAQRAVEVVEKQQQRTNTENKNISLRVENNKTEFAQLNKAIKNNRLDSVNLQKRLGQNLHAKDSLVIVLEKVKQAVEFQKERQRKVN